ncbi:MAG: Uma2 family endonuclease [Verrucomicrobia bacterium]|nr:Uma2 family endonuclease [Verrucomicrobiota bacterium]
MTIKFPQQGKQTEYNLRRWTEVLADPGLTKFEGRIETDRHGHTLMSPPPAPRHGSFQSEIAFQLRSLIPIGRVLTECPIFTADGVKAADVAWASAECMGRLGDRSCFPQSPEFCVEVLSPGNTDAEVQEKMALYFDVGAAEVWLCSTSGAMTFSGPRTATHLKESQICPKFPGQVELR